MILSKDKPVFGTLEWASHNENFISGCAHDCRYCYSKAMAIRFKRKTASSWSDEEVNYKKLGAKVKKYNGKVMFPSSHDITPRNLENAIEYLLKLLEVGNDVLLVAKPHIEVAESICQICRPFKDQLLFRYTIGSADSDVLKFWEPNAPSFDDRFQALRHTFDMGFDTSVSIEPMLDTVDNIIELTNDLIPSVTDAVWIGKPNFLIRRLETNEETGREVFERARQLESWCTDSEIYRLYKTFECNPKVKWKESIKKIVGINVPTQKGLDI